MPHVYLCMRFFTTPAYMPARLHALTTQNVKHAFGRLTAIERAQEEKVR